jgi:polyisoprenoid-binding protein YceI
MKMRHVACVAVLAGGVALGVGFGPRWSETTSAVQAGEWKIDNVHSSMMFRIKHMNTAFFYGRFNDLSGQIVWDESNPATTAFNVEVKTTSVDTKAEGRDKHLRSADFFNAEQFPTATFKSTKATSKGSTSLDVTGDMTINGVTKPVTATIEKTGSGKSRRGGDLVGFETVFTIKRSDFGITFMPDGLGDEVKIFASFEAERQP